jgi:hypothetical protein
LPSNRSEPDWLLAVTDWIDAQLDEAGLQRTGGVHQLYVAP